MSEIFRVDGWLRQSREAAKRKLFGYRLAAGIYETNTNRIIINLDLCLENICYDCGGYCKKPRETCIDQWIETISRTISHEHIHKILHKQVSLEACSNFDNLIVIKGAEG